MAFTPSEKVRAIRDEVDHPVIDGDGHLLEIIPVVLELVGQLADPGVAKAFTRYLGTMFTEGSGFTPVRQPFWGSPGPTVDRLTTALPALMYERLDEFGLDFALLYPGIGLRADVMRRRRFAAGGCSGDQHLLRPAVRILWRPDDADRGHPDVHARRGSRRARPCSRHARAESSGDDRRRASPPRADGVAGWIDTLGHDSDFDYDPVWARCQDLGVVPAFHGIGFGWGSRTSRTNYVYNHLGNFAAAQEAICRSLVMGGVTTRFPDLRFAFLEGGVTWAAQLYADLIGHWEKRNGRAILANDPSAIDTELADRLIDDYGTGPLVRAGRTSVDRSARTRASRSIPPRSTSSLRRVSTGRPTWRASSPSSSTSAVKPTIRSMRWRSRRDSCPSASD